MTKNTTSKERVSKERVKELSDQHCLHFIRHLSGWKMHSLFQDRQGNDYQGLSGYMIHMETDITFSQKIK